MIRVRRGLAPKELASVRKSGLRALQKIAAKRRPVRGEITGYAIVGEALWNAQHHKCCYCEKKIEKGFNDVEHYRPKTTANRAPGSNETHGYWWLAFTWKNLLFACSRCNRSSKNALFPLMRGGMALRPTEQPPGKEQPLFLDPAVSNPVEHIEFYLAPNTGHWLARARHGSEFGRWTIEVCDLNRGQGLIELRMDHVEHVVRPYVDELQQALATAARARIKPAFERARGLLNPASAYVALSYDALCHFVPNAQLTPWKLSWPLPTKVGLPKR